MNVHELTSILKKLTTETVAKRIEWSEVWVGPSNQSILTTRIGELCVVVGSSNFSRLSISFFLKDHPERRRQIGLPDDIPEAVAFKHALKDCVTSPEVDAALRTFVGDQ